VVDGVVFGTVVGDTVVGGAVGGGGFAVVGEGLGVAVECRRVVVDPRRVVVPGDAVVGAPGTVDAGDDVLVDEVGASEVATIGMGRPALTRGGKPAMATPMAAHTTSSTTTAARFVTGPCSSMAAA
jgi:hypothetical protein